MFGSFAADESRTRLNTSLTNTADDGCDFFGNILSAGDIVEEEKRLCSAADNVVNAHCNGIDTDCIMLVHEYCELNLCSAAVGTADQNGFFHPCRETETSAETANVV